MQRVYGQENNIPSWCKFVGIKPIPIFEHLGTIMPTINVHKYFVIATNYPTKWAELQPMVLKDYELIAQFFFDKIPMQYACPQKILSDNAPN